MQSDWGKLVERLYLEARLDSSQMVLRKKWGDEVVYI
jgi:hypothetical protein